MKIYRKKTAVIIDANYEARTELFEGRVDAVLIFDDLVYTIE